MKHKFLNLLLLPLPMMAGMAGITSCSNIDRMADKDYDGLPDAIDDKPEDNTVEFRYYDFISLEEDTSADAKYHMDYRYFVDMDPNKYHQEIAQICMPLLTNAYMFMDVQYKDSNNQYISSTTRPNFLERLGIWDVENIDLYDEIYTDMDDCDLIFAKIGHHEFIYQGQKRQVFFVPIRGTTSFTEAVSDFDVGIDNPSYTTNRETEHPYWKNPDHHKGFDVTANRVREKVDDYMRRYKQNDCETIVVLTGHSRGASVANILGKQFTDEGIKNFTYCIAPAPVTFGSVSEGEYQNIINIVSVHDIVPDIRTNDNKFKRYGQDINGDIDKMREAYKKFMPGWAPDFLDPKFVTDFWASQLPTRDSIYAIPDAEAATDNDDYYKYTASTREQAESAQYTISNRLNVVHPTLGRFAQLSTIKENTTTEEPSEKFYFYVTTSLGFLIEVMHTALSAPFDALDCIQYMMRFFRIGIDLPVIGKQYEPGFATVTLIKGFQMGYRNLIMMHLPPTYQIIVDNTPSQE